MKIRFREIMIVLLFFLLLLNVVEFELNKITIIQIAYLMYFYFLILVMPLFMLMKPRCMVQIRKKTGFTTNRIKVALLIAYLIFVLILEWIKPYIFGDKVIYLSTAFVCVSVAMVVSALIYPKNK